MAKNKKKAQAETSPQTAVDLQDLRILGNPWDNVYWFARMLINTDKYGGVGTDSKTMLQLGAGIREIAKKEKDETIAVQTSMNFIENLLSERWGDTKRMKDVEQLIEDLGEQILTLADLEVFCLTCERVMVTINESLKVIPNDDREFAYSMATALLQTKGERGLAEIINLWDDLGVRGCLAAERAEVVKNFGRLRTDLSRMMKQTEELDMVLSAFCQEYERRLGQKRKGRAGRTVEGVTSFILNFYGIPTTHAPEHFTARLEVDRWIRCSDGWLIGISCKRTLRERWKQAYTTEMGLLDRHKIKHIWHVITFDRDLSDDKLTEMGSHRVIFYLRDESERYRSASKHIGMKNYVRPMSRFIQAIRSEQS